MKILVVEDETLIRQFIAKTCRDCGHEVIGETDGGREALTLSRQLHPDILFLDLGLPDLSGVTVAQIVCAESPILRVVIVSANCTESWIYRIERLPIRGFIDKNTCMIAAIEEALRRIAAGQSYFSPAYLKARDVRRCDPNSFTKKLTDWEQTILGYMARGLSDREIGAILKIAPRTVEDHRSNIKRKLEIESSMKLAAFGVQKGLHQFPLVAAPRRQ